MIRIRKIFVVLWLCSLISACSVVGVSEWNAYKITIEVRDTSNQLIPVAEVSGAIDEIKKSDNRGIFYLLYAKTGLQVITVSAPEKQTKQIKISVPADQDKVFTVILHDK